MEILFVLIPLTLILVAGGCWAFFWAVDAGQFDDLDSPGWDVLEDVEGAELGNPGQNAERAASSSFLPEHRRPSSEP